MRRLTGKECPPLKAGLRWALWLRCHKNREQQWRDCHCASSRGWWTVNLRYHSGSRCYMSLFTNSIDFLVWSSRIWSSHLWNGFRANNGSSQYPVSDSWGRLTGVGKHHQRNTESDRGVASRNMHLSVIRSARSQDILEGTELSDNPKQNGWSAIEREREKE
jgi:hypothetical protein